MNFMLWTLLGLCLGVAAFAQQLDSGSGEDVPPTPGNSTDDTDGGDQKTGLGKGYGHHHRHHDDYHHDFIPPFPHERPFHDTHYCSVHGSFALSYSKKESYPQQYGPPEERHHRKFIREFCRFSASHSAKSCKFCCKIVARSAYTNPDDIVSAIFAFDPANPTSGGVGLPVHKRHHHHHHDHHDHHHHGGYNNNNNYGGGNPYGQQQPQQYQQNQPNYPQPPPASGNNYPGGQGYRAKRQSPGTPTPQDLNDFQQRFNAANGAFGNGPAPPPPAVSTDAETPAPATGPAQPIASDSYAPVNQCVCCAPKTHYYHHHHDHHRHHHRHHHHDDY